MGKNREKYIEEKKSAWKIFDRIYKRYDLLNHLLSFGFDFRWRKKMSTLIGEKKGGTLLDLATGTGDVMFSLIKHSGRFNKAVGVDMSFNMLKYAIRKSVKRKNCNTAEFVLGDANFIPAKTGSFDIVTMAFGIRNISVPSTALRDIHRILAEGGSVLILEFSLPENPIARGAHLVYLRYLLPVIGKIVSGDVEAYRYLNETIETFPYGNDFISLMKKAGFKNCERFPLPMGIVTIYKGIKTNG